MTDLVYNASPTLELFHSSPAFIRQLIGPIGSGKSVGCVIELVRLASQQARGPDGKRRSRWAVIRNSYRELKDTTIATFNDWIPVGWREWIASDFKTVVRVGDVEAEFLFRALDRPEDVKKLLSLELTGAWLNENREIPKAIFDMIQGRVGRFPSKRDGGPTRYCIVCDTNPPDDDHYVHRLFVEERPEGFEIFHQPSAMADNAENRENLPDGYYERLRHGKTQAWINVYVHGQYGYVQEGKPVYPEYQSQVHLAKHIIQPDPDRTLYVGLDFGLTPAACFMQQNVFGQWQAVDELVTDDMGASRFAVQLGKKLRRDYRGYDVELVGDPAGEQRAQTDEQTPYDILAAHKLNAAPATTNDFTLRREAVATNLTRLGMDGKPGLIISPKCRILNKGLAGRYRFRRVQVVGDERFHDKPDKNQFSHVCEAQQYALIGAGEDATVVGTDPNEWGGWDDDLEDYDWDEGVI